MSVCRVSRLATRPRGDAVWRRCNGGTFLAQQAHRVHVGCFQRLELPRQLGVHRLQRLLRRPETRQQLLKLLLFGKRLRGGRCAARVKGTLASMSEPSSVRIPTENCNETRIFEAAAVTRRLKAQSVTRGNPTGGLRPLSRRCALLPLAHLLRSASGRRPLASCFFGCHRDRCCQPPSASRCRAALATSATS